MFPPDDTSFRGLTFRLKDIYQALDIKENTASSDRHRLSDDILTASPSLCDWFNKPDINPEEYISKMTPAEFDKWKITRLSAYAKKEQARMEKEREKERERRRALESGNDSEGDDGSPSRQRPLKRMRRAGSQHSDCTLSCWMVKLFRFYKRHS